MQVLMLPILRMWVLSSPVLEGKMQFFCVREKCAPMGYPKHAHHAGG